MTRPTKEELAEWRRLADEATAGPWIVCGAHENRCPCRFIWSKTADFVVAEAVRKDDEHEIPDDDMQSNKAFIAVSRDAIPRLLDRIDELEAALRGAKLEPQIIECNASCGLDEHNARIDEVLGECGKEDSGRDGE